MISWHTLICRYVSYSMINLFRISYQKGGQVMLYPRYYQRTVQSSSPNTLFRCVYEPGSDFHYFNLEREVQWYNVHHCFQCSNRCRFLLWCLSGSFLWIFLPLSSLWCNWFYPTTPGQRRLVWISVLIGRTMPLRRVWVPSSFQLIFWLSRVILWSMCFLGAILTIFIIQDHN